MPRRRRDRAPRVARCGRGAGGGARAEIDTAARDRDWLEHAVGELDALAPEPGEEETLADRRRTMQRAGEDRRRPARDRGAGVGRRGRPVEAAPGRAHPRARRARSCRAGRGAGGDRPRGDRRRAGRGSAGRGAPRARIRSARAGGRRGAAVRTARHGAQAPRPARRPRRRWPTICAASSSGSTAARRASPRWRPIVARKAEAYAAAAAALSQARARPPPRASTRRSPANSRR